MTDPIIFATSNQTKFSHATEVCGKYGITLNRQHVDLIEIQSASGKEITEHKALQAFEILQRPVIVNDDSWNIPELRGFPGAYMKYINDWFTADNWLDLTRSLKDRTMILEQHIVYHDGSQTHYFVKNIEALLLDSRRGTGDHSHLEIISFDGGTHSVAELKNANLPAVPADTPTAWDAFARWMNAN